MINQPDFDREVDFRVIDFESWSKKNNSTNVEQYCQQHNLAPNVRLQLRKILEMENWLVNLVDSEGTSHSESMEFENKRIGNYELIELLGTGGMGTVWLARQTEPVNRRVAIKLIRGDRKSEVSTRRFEREKQALASMSHNNIARVLNAGLADDGRPYIAMEYISGEPIVEYCEHRQSSLSTRLNLFLQLCSAIQHAHQKSLLHRDLKPSNILVTEVDGEPVVKVIDFGMARQSDSWKPEITQAEMVIGSPLWMSPEQARGFRSEASPEEQLDSVDTRTDIYSLGVILYQLLTESTPISNEFFERATKLELLHEIQKTTPQLPSIRVNKLRGDSTSESTPVSNWARVLRNELDWVTMRALEKDRDRRYPTVAAFADDIRNYLNDEPVVARPPSLLYRLKKIGQKHKVGVIASLAAIATVFLTSIFFAIFLMKTIHAQRIASQADLHKDQTMALSAEMLQHFNPSNDESTSGEKKFLLDQFRDELDQNDYSDKPLLEAGYRESIANAYSGLGVHQSAIDQYRTLIAIYNRNLGELDRKTIGAKLELSKEHLLHREFKEAQQIGIACRDASAIAFDAKDKLSIVSRLVVAKSSMNEKDVQQSIAELVKIVEIAEAELGEFNPDTIECIASLAHAYSCAGRGIEAVELSKEAYNRAEQAFGSFDRRSMELKIQDAQLRVIAGVERVPEAELSRLSDRAAARFGDIHVFTIRLNLRRAAQLVSKGKYETARELIVSLVKKTDLHFGDDHELTLESRYRLGLLHFQLAKGRDRTNRKENLETALSILQEVSNSYIRLHGLKSPKTVEVRSQIAGVLFIQMNYAETIETVNQLLPLVGEPLDYGGESATDLVEWKAKSLYKLGNQEEALKFAQSEFQQSLKISQPSSKTGMLAKLIADLASLKRESKMAIDYFQKALDIFVVIEGKHGANTHWALANLQNEYMRIRDFNQVQKYARRSIEYLSNNMTNSSMFEQGAKVNLGESLCEQGNFAEGEPLLVEASNLDNANPGPEYWLCYRAKSSLALRHIANANLDEARELLLEAKANFESTKKYRIPQFAWFLDRCNERLNQLDSSDQ